MDSTEAWLEKAEEDFETACFLHENAKYEHAVFLFQQAVEKGLKAVLIGNNDGVPQSHDCFNLAKKANAPTTILEAANAVSPYYFRTRYPDASLVDLDNDDIETVHDHAETVIEWVRKTLSDG